VELLDYMTVDDVGRIINPATLHGQILGAIVQGLGSTFLEHLQYDENGQLLTGSLADYLMPTAADFPNIRVIALEEHPNLHPFETGHEVRCWMYHDARGVPQARPARRARPDQPADPASPATSTPA